MHPVWMSSPSAMLYVAFTPGLTRTFMFATRPLVSCVVFVGNVSLSRSCVNASKLVHPHCVSPPFFGTSSM